MCSGPFVPPERGGLPSVQWALYPSWERRFTQCAVGPSSLLREQAYPVCSGPLIPLERYGSPSVQWAPHPWDCLQYEKTIGNRICGLYLLKIKSTQFFTIYNVRKLAKNTKLFKPYGQIKNKVIKSEFGSSIMFPRQKLFMYLSQSWKLGIVLVIQTLRFRKDNKHMCKYFLHIHCMCKQKNVSILLCKWNIYIIRHLFPSDNGDPKGIIKIYIIQAKLDIVLF